MLERVIASFGNKRTKELSLYHHRLGRVLASLGDKDVALTQLDMAFKIDPGSIEVTIALRSGTGKVVVTLVGAVISALELHASHGTVDVAIPATLGATIAIVSETGEDITLRLPEDFAADVVTIDGPSAKVDTTAFPDLQVGKGRGAAGTGARSISVRSGVAGGAMGAVKIVAQATE